MTTGRSGKRYRTNADRKGCAEGQTPAQDRAPPFSSRRCRDCTAGVCATAAKRPFATAPTRSLAKLGQSRTTTDAASRGGGKRPDRIEPRAVKSVKNTYPRLSARTALIHHTATESAAKISWINPA